MVLPFTPLSLTFHHLNYYVDVPKVLPPTTKFPTVNSALTSVGGLPCDGCLCLLCASCPFAFLCASCARYCCTQEGLFRPYCVHINPFAAMWSASDALHAYIFRESRRIRTRLARA